MVTEPAIRTRQEGEMAPSSPTVARWELALRLRNRRAELGLDVKTITDHLGFTRNYWSQVENERAVMAEDRLRALCELFQFDDSETAELLALRNESRQRGWWEDYTNLFEEEGLRLLGLEHGATRIRTFESLIIPGLLQTEEYARAMISSDPMRSAVDVPLALELRMRRQQRLTGDTPLRFVAVISEAALYQQIDGPRVQARQLDSLLDTAQDPSNSVEVRVLPLAGNPGPIVGSSTLVLMDFESSHLDSIVWQEAIRPLRIVDADQSQRLELSFSTGLANALDPIQSLTLIDKARANMHQA